MAITLVQLPQPNEFFDMKNVFNIVVIACVAGFAFISSCKKEIVPTIAEIRVITQDGEPVPFAEILLTCTSSVGLPCEIEIEGQANADGIYTKEFDLPKVLLVSAGKLVADTTYVGIPPVPVITTDTICGSTTISIKPEQTSVQQVILYDCK